MGCRNPEKGDICFPMMADDGKVVVIKALKPTLEDHLAIVLMTQPEKEPVAARLFSMRFEDEVGLGAKTVDVPKVAALTMRCECEPHVLAKESVHRTHNRVWDLTEFHGPGKGPPGGYWRLIELGSCYPSFPWYGWGCINKRGELVGLPNNYTSTYSYWGHLEIQIGCPCEDDEEFVCWPGTCQPRTARSRMPC